MHMDNLTLYGVSQHICTTRLWDTIGFTKITDSIAIDDNILRGLDLLFLMMMTRHWYLL